MFPESCVLMLGTNSRHTGDLKMGFWKGQKCSTAPCKPVSGPNKRAAFLGPHSPCLMHLNLAVPLHSLSAFLVILLFWGIIFLAFEDKWAEGDGKHNGIVNAVLGMRKDREVLRDIASSTSLSVPLKTFKR